MSTGLLPAALVDLSVAVGALGSFVASKDHHHHYWPTDLEES